jgi:hypothetical protein
VTFTTLEARFNATADTLYRRYDNAEQLQQIKPNSSSSRSRIKDDSRALPIVSTGRDLAVMGKFLTSLDKGGPQFLAKQLLLQTGNTFAETRLYNPLGVLIHTLPFVHRPRNVGKVPAILSSIQTDRGALQTETINKFTQGQSGPIGRLISGVATAATAPFRAIATEPTKVNGFYERPEDKLIVGKSLQTFELQSLSTRGERKTGPELSKLLPTLREFSLFTIVANAKHRGIITWDASIGGNARRSTTPKQTYSGVAKTLYAIDNRYLTAVDSVDITETKLQVPDDDTFTSQFNRFKSQKFYTYEDKPSTGLTKKTETGNFADLEGTLFNNPYFSSQYSYNLSTPGANNSLDIQSNGVSNIRDPYNSIVVPEYTDIQRVALESGSMVYNKISGNKREKSDIIQFVFNAIDGSEPVHFRALISNIKQNVKPEYNETRYVGRTERFVTYAGAKRSTTLEFNVIALSRRELENMWTRINYLTGLAFPRGASTSGFMIPPLFKLTVGGIYDNQPCYVESLDFTMLDESITFDIDKEVSQTIAVSMTITLLEKRSAFYNSPFYGISQKIQQQDSALSKTNSPRLSDDLVSSTFNSIQTSLDESAGLFNADQAARVDNLYPRFDATLRRESPFALPIGPPAP